jgi:hypothetical protein
MSIDDRNAEGHPGRIATVRVALRRLVSTRVAVIFASIGLIALTGTEVLLDEVCGCLFKCISGELW